jgi:hypothetical protein
MKYLFAIIVSFVGVTNNSDGSEIGILFLSSYIDEP